jgi:hypothetical protein
MRRVLVIGLIAALAITGLSRCPVVVAQENAQAMLLGTWQGKVAFGDSAPAVIEFSESAGTVKWEFSFKHDATVLWGDAAGTVMSFSPPALELAGAYTKHAVSGVVGTRVKFSLTVDGDRMTGTLIPDISKLPVAVSLTRKK